MNEVEERAHIIHVLDETREALKNNDSPALKDLSNQTIHCASCIQDTGSIIIAVLNYALSKIIERGKNSDMPSWKSFVSEFSEKIDSAAHALAEENEVKYQSELVKARKLLENAAGNIKPYIHEVLRNAAINKASKLYEHGISRGQTANLLGITQWELSEYSGPRVETKPEMNQKISVNQRAQMALEFLS